MRKMLFSKKREIQEKEELRKIVLFRFSFASFAQGSTVPKLKDSTSCVKLNGKASWVICSTTLENVALVIDCVMPSGHLACSAVTVIESGAAFLNVIWPFLVGLISATCPCVGPNVAVCPGGLLPPLFVHSVWAVTPDVVKNTPVGVLLNPATLPLTVRVAVVPDIVLVIVGVPMKCGDAAAARIGAISSKADAAIVEEGIPIFLIKVAVIFLT